MITVFKGRRMVIIRIEIKNIVRKEKKARNIKKVRVLPLHRTRRMESCVFSLLLCSAI